MDGEPYWYFVKYNAEINVALQALRQAEFKAGRYAPVIDFPSELFPLGPTSPAPGAKHPTIEAALAAADESGTRSILDLDHIAKMPEYGAVCPISDRLLQNLFGTLKPTRKMVEDNMDFLEEVERGQGIYIIYFKDEQPEGICFAGYSYD